ncbi:wax ester/triacylglycerol synthase family O-acyltransferase, partial [Ilumatobacter sp.]|uniref:wax ester/triacylglycerol synthase family O-acyltransferase n=1 Tax=Ilumatobacter sp. TaxID=1967498 RepID=UPI003AF9DE7A
GVGLLDVFLDASRRPKRRTPDQLPELRAAPSSGSSAPSVTEIAAKSASAQLKLAKTAIAAALHPATTAGTTLAGGKSAARLLAPSGAALSPLFSERGPERRLATHETEFERLHDAAARHGCTINHLFIAGVLDGAARYHRVRGSRPPQLRVTMPISIRSSGDNGGGNQWAPVRFRLPTDIDDPIERMLTIREITGRSRKEPALGFSHSLAGAIQILPSSVSAGVVGGMMRGVDLTVTNVPGLSEPRYLAGAHVERMYPFAPTAGAAFNVALMSHESTACFGIMSDTTAVGDADELHAEISAGIDRVLNEAETRPAARAVVRSEIDHEPKRLSTVDTSFLRIETPDTPMHIGILFVLDGDGWRGEQGELLVGDIRRHISARLGRAPRAMRRLAEVPFGQGRPVWVEDPDFDIAHHVKLASVASPGGEAELYAEVCELDMECLDRSRPLWESWLIDQLADGRVGVFLKVHHAVLDGAGFFDFINTLFDVEPLSGPEVPIRGPVAPLPSPGRLLTDAWAENLRDPVEVVRQSTRTLLSAPATIAGQVGDLVAAGFGVIGSGAAPETSLNRQVGRRRQLLSLDLDFTDIGAIRSALGGTANDVALAVLTGGLRSWFDGHHEPLEELQALCPVSLREPGTASEWGNRTGVMMIPLPLAEPDPARRLEMIRERTTRAKARHEGAAVLALADAADHLPAAIPNYMGAALRSLIARQTLINLVITNVPGPREPVWLMGAEAEALVPIVPLGSNTALGVALASYLDTLTIGLYADPDRCPDLDQLATAITDEMDRLLAASSP